MANSARTVRDVVVSEKQSEDSHEQAFIEHEERMVAIQASAQTVSDLQSCIDVLDQPPSLTSNFPTLTLSCWR